jgi:hypothetical protein
MHSVFQTIGDDNQLEANMRHSSVITITTAVLLVLLLLVGMRPAHADFVDSAGFSLGWWTVDGGGGTSTATGFSLSGTAGQPDAGALTGTGFRLAGGFWGGQPGQILMRPLYLPIIKR